MAKVQFDLNYKTLEEAPKAQEIESGGVLDVITKPRPSREGYMFKGWFTSPECKPEEEWLFGVKLKSFNPPEVIGAMPVTQDMTLYAGWQAPIHIKDEASLNNIRQNLKGWYVLDNDIVLSDKPWEPIGEWEPTYEYADAEWWSTAFRGKIDGMGHTIRNLHLTHGPSNFIGLISTAGNCTITNLNIEDTVIEIDSPSAYIAPLIGVVRQGQGARVEVSNCRIARTTIKAKLTSDEFIYSSISALAAGMWDGDIINCQIDADILVNVTGKAKNNIFIGGLLGEGYSHSENSKSEVKIVLNLLNNGGDNIYLGPLQASGTSVNNCQAKGSITVSGKTADEEGPKVFVGGLIGSLRYDDTKNSEGELDLNLKDLPYVQLGGVTAEFNKAFGVIGPMVGVSHSGIFDCKTEIRLSQNNIGKILSGEVSGEGIPKPLQGWGGMLTYDIQNNKCSIK